ncbi:MAG: putative Zn-dependent protease [Planctomycetota bacterium]
MKKESIMFKSRLCVLLLALSTLGACVTNPETGKSSFNIVPESTEISMGVQAFADVKAETRLSSNTVMTDVVKRVADRITAVTGKDYAWEVRLVESEQANAFVLPGGKIVIYTGLLPICETEAGLAFVMGHEVGHAIARHGGQRISTTMIVQAGMQVADLSFNNNSQKPMIMAALGAGTQLGTLKYSRSHESEADYMGIRYMAKAGYDPIVAPDLWVRMGKGSQQPPEILSTHPAHETRTADLKAVMKEAQKLYQASPQKYGLGVNL